MQPSYSMHTILLFGLLGVSPLAMGCYSFWGCDAIAACEQPEEEPEGPFCPEDPVDGSPDASCGIWVSALSGDDFQNPGTPERPVQTLARGIELAKVGPGRVYACGGTYVEAVELPDGVDLLGGFECQDLSHWNHVGIDEAATVLAPVALAAFLLPESERESLIGDVQIVASDALEHGSSSIAVLALPGARARFRRTAVTAGNGADGADGADGSPDGQSAAKGTPGHDGADACTMDIGAGGPAVTTSCDGADSIGGGGGDANAVFANDGLAGSPVPEPNDLGYGSGGMGENLAKGTGCTPGIAGAHGKDGANGQGAKDRGHLTIDGYVGAPGGDGQAGAPGQGGGGGGASLGVCAVGPSGGAGGGSGGSGGCGGKPGKGGQAGGSSIAIALLSNDVFMEYNVILRAGDGGRGGDGGFGQAGGQGGLPGYGGLSAPGGSQAGCFGGGGGLGGYGGYGGGGHGGHSLVVALGAWTSPSFGGYTADVGQAGAGGLGGIPGTTVGDGSPGISAKFLSFDP